MISSPMFIIRFYTTIMLLTNTEKVSQGGRQYQYGLGVGDEDVVRSSTTPWIWRQPLPELTWAGCQLPRTNTLKLMNRSVFHYFTFTGQMLFWNFIVCVLRCFGLVSFKFKLIYDLNFLRYSFKKFKKKKNNLLSNMYLHIN